MERTKVIRNLISAEQTLEIAGEYVDHNSRVTPILVASWDSLIRYALQTTTETVFPHIIVKYTDSQPYASASEMRASIDKYKVLEISTQYNTADGLSPIFGGNTDLNLLFRTVHDMHHCMTQDCNFELDGEICAYSKFAKNCLQWGYVYRVPTMAHVLIQVLASEVIGQVCYLRHNGEFPNQVFNTCVPFAIIDRILTAYNVW